VVVAAEEVVVRQVTQHCRALMGFIGLHFLVDRRSHS